MAIQLQVPTQAPASSAPSNADILSLLTGNPVDVKVVGAATDGLTQLLLGKGAIKLALPTQFPAGTELTLQIKNGQLFVQPQGQAASPPVRASPPPLPQPPAPLPQAGTNAPPPVPGAAAQPYYPANALQAQLQASMATPRAALPSAPLANPMLPMAPQAPASAPAAPVLPQQSNLAGLPVSQPNSANGTPGPAPQAGLQMLAPAPRPDAMGALLANLSTFEARLAQMPPPVAAAARQFLNQQINLAKGALSGERLRQAIVSAGMPSVDEPEASLPRTPLAPLVLRTNGPPDELKASLLQLRSTLLSWVGQDTIEAAAAAIARPAPPRVGPPRAARIDPMPLSEGDAPDEIGKSLLEQTDAALSRLRPAHAGQPADPANRPDPAQAAPRSEWNGQVPMFLGAEAGLAQFQVFRDGGGADGAMAAQAWQVRFAINFSAIGEVGAHVLLRGTRASVTIWAERDDTADALDTLLPDLAEALDRAGLQAGAIQVRHGAPKPNPVPAGGLVDSAT